VLQKFPDIDVYALAHDNLMSPDMAQRYFGFTYEPTGKPPTKYDLQFSISHFPRKATKAAAYSGLILFPSVEPHHIHEFATIYAISQYTAGYVEQYWGRHADLLYPPTTYSCDDRMPVKKDLMLCIGRLVTFKRHAEIAQAFMQAQMPPGWELVIAGTTGENAPYEAELAELAKQNKKITLLTNVTDAELKELYDRAKILVGGMGLYSTTPHGFEHWGLTQVEAMSRGCVPVMFSGGGHREPYQKYLWNSLEELVRTLRHLSEQGEELSRQSNEVREKAREYTVPVFAKKLHRAIMESIYGTVDQEGRAQALMGVKAMELSTSAVSGLFGVGLTKLSAGDTLRFDLENSTSDVWTPRDTQVVGRWGNGKTGDLIPQAPTRKVPIPTAMLPGDKIQFSMPVPYPPIGAGFLHLHIDVLRWGRQWLPQVSRRGKVRIIP